MQKNKFFQPSGQNPPTHPSISIQTTILSCVHCNQPQVAVVHDIGVQRAMNVFIVPSPLVRLSTKQETHLVKVYCSIVVAIMWAVLWAWELVKYSQEWTIVYKQELFGIYKFFSIYTLGINHTNQTIFPFD